MNRDDDDNRTLKVVKLKDGEDGEKIGFELQSVTIGTYDSGKPMTSCVVRPAEVGSTRTGIARLSTGQELFLTSLSDAIAQYGGGIPPTCNAPAGVYGVEWTHFRDLYKAVRGQEMNDNALRQALMREGDGVLKRGLIGRFDHWIWLTPSGDEYLTRRGR